MDLLHLILFIVLANTVPFSGARYKEQMILFAIMSFILGCEQRHEVLWLDGTLYTSGGMAGQAILYFNTITPDLAPAVLDKATQLSGSSRFLSVNSSDNTVRLYLDFVHMSVADTRVYIDGYIAEWNSANGCFQVDLNSDVTPRVDNTSLIENDFNGVTLEVRTNGVPIKHLKFVK